MSCDTVIQLKQCVIIRQKVDQNVRHFMLHWLHLHVCDLNDVVNDEHPRFFYLISGILYFIPHYNSTCRGLASVQLMTNYEVNFIGGGCLRKIWRTKGIKGASWSWSYGSWIYNFLCNQCLSPLTCELESRSGEVYSVQHYVIKFVSDLWQVGGFLRFPPPIKLIATIYLKYCWKWR
jgi:hypothetical protein